MQQDPFYEVKEEVQQAIQGINTLYERWKDLLNTTNTYQNEEFKWTANELKNGLQTIEVDLSELEETINVVQSNKSKFRIDDMEIMNRKSFIQSTKQRIQAIKDDMSSLRSKGKMEKDQKELLIKQKKPADKYEKYKANLEQENEAFISDQNQQQSLIMRDQDQRIETLSDTVRTLHVMGEQIGDAIKTQEGLITDLHTDVDRVDGKVQSSVKRVNELLDKMKDGHQWCVIIFLICVLIALVVLVFYV